MITNYVGYFAKV